MEHGKRIVIILIVLVFMLAACAQEEDTLNEYGLQLGDIVQVDRTGDNEKGDVPYEYMLVIGVSPRSAILQREPVCRPYVLNEEWRIMSVNEGIPLGVKDGLQKAGGKCNP